MCIRDRSDREESDEFDDMPDQSNEGGFEYNDGVTDKNFADNLRTLQTQTTTTIQHTVMCQM